MRYKKTQIVHQVMIDEEVEGSDSIKKLLDNIRDSYIDISLECFVPETESSVLWKRVRILSVGTDSVNIQIFSGNCTAKSEIKMTNIKFIGVVTDRSGILSSKSEVTAYDFLDLSDK